MAPKGYSWAGWSKTERRNSTEWKKAQARARTHRIECGRVRKKGREQSKHPTACTLTKTATSTVVVVVVVIVILLFTALTVFLRSCSSLWLLQQQQQQQRQPHMWYCERVLRIMMHVICVYAQHSYNHRRMPCVYPRRSTVAYFTEYNWNG